MSRSAVVIIVAVAGVYLVVLPTAAIGFVIYAALNQDTTGCRAGGGPGGGQQQLGDQTYSAEQMTNAETITQTTAARGYPRRAAVITVMAALTESTLGGPHGENIHHGDRDSLGLFQMRPSMGWGSAEQVTNPVYATNTFLDHLQGIHGGWQNMQDGDAAQAVEQSGYPDRYQPHQQQAEKLVDRFWRGPDNPLPAPPGAASPPVQAVSAQVNTGCPDQGGSNLPLDPQHVRQLPPGYQLPADPRQRAAVEYALAQLGKKYVWGAKGPDTFDCSGLVQAAWAHAGTPIPAGTSGQVSAGDPVPGVDAVQPGDLLLIPGSDGTAANPGHVGMYIGSNTVVNAYDEKTGVVLDSLDHWKGQVVGIRRPAQPAGLVLAGGQRL